LNQPPFNPNAAQTTRGLLRRARVTWSAMAPATRRLLAARFWRSIGQGMLVVDLALYLRALGWSGAAIGLVLSAAGLVGAGLNLAVGVTSDRLRRKPFLLAYEVMTCVCALVAMSRSDAALLSTAIVLAGFGRGANGAAGPFAPAEQAWLAEAVELPQRGFIYSLNTAFGFIGMALGALAGASPALWIRALGQANSFRPLFFLVLFGNAINVVLLATTPERRRVALRTPGQRSAAPSRSDRRARENRFLVSLMSLNAFNGMAVGLTGPLISYWFAVRFGVGPRVIGPVMAITFAVTAASAFAMGYLTQRFGLVRAVVWGRSGGVVLLMLLPLMPLYALAALVYVARSALNRGTVGARQALVISVVGDERRGLAASLNALSMQLPMSAGPAIAGALIGGGWLAAPFYAAGALQGLYVYFYNRVFGPVERAVMDEGDL
jgi:MFS family permease